MILGDFDDLLTGDEKMGGAERLKWKYSGFRKAILDCNLSDVPLQGYQFTWNNGREASNRVEERLDRSMGSLSWHAKFNTAKLLNLVAPISDHNPIVLDTSPAVMEHHVRRFRFENRWLDEPDVTSVVSRSWEGFRDFELTKRLKATGDVLADWGRHVALAGIRNKRDIESQIEALQGCTNAESLERLTTLRTKLETLLDSEEKYWKQRAKAHWLKEGDLNTRFFHQMASTQKKRNKILGLYDDGGIWVEDSKGLERDVLSYFKDKSPGSERF